MKPVITARVHENTEQGMFGKWIMPSGRMLFFGTLQWLFNQSDVSSIPYGKYDFHLVKSAKRSAANREKHQAEIDAQPEETREQFAEQFDVNVYQMYDATPADGIDDTAGRVAVQVHIGNYCGDESKGWKSDVEGCFILGLALGEDPETSQRMTKGSSTAYDIFMKEMGGRDWTLDFGAAV